jgi:hypothetical protein
MAAGQASSQYTFKVYTASCRVSGGGLMAHTGCASCRRAAVSAMACRVSHKQQDWQAVSTNCL